MLHPASPPTLTTRLMLNCLFASIFNERPESKNVEGLPKIMGPVLNFRSKATPIIHTKALSSHAVAERVPHPRAQVWAELRIQRHICMAELGAGKRRKAENAHKTSV